MPASINDLPYELLSQILENVICFNVEQNSRRTYGFDMELHAPPDPDVRMQRLLKGLMTPDSVRWTASNTIRRVNSRWHDLALKYSFRDLYVLSWRGSEKHMLSGVVRTTSLEHLSLSTFSDSSTFLSKTASLLENHPTLSSYIRRIWFDGYYEAKESAMIFGILRQCKKLEDLLIPWTTLRHGTVAGWSSLFGTNAAGPCVTSLEIRAMNLPKRSPAMKKENHFGNNALESTSVDFNNLACLRLFGNSKFMTITDKDLMAIARTASNLRELHVSNAASLGPKGIGALIRSSRLSLEVLELDGSSQMEPEEPEQPNSYSHLRLPRLIAQCPLLRRLRLQSVHTCRDIFACDDVAWSGKVQICLGVTSYFQVPQPDEDTTILYQVLDQARCFMDSRTRSDKNLVDIEIFTSGFIFEPGCALVHGDFPTTHAVRGPWLVKKKESYRNSQMNGYVSAFPFCITEDEFRDGLIKGYVWI
ncbi:hypothetical protein HO173_001870 [Letharia columbiana]|uniref:F-box domain-containing protein n=1 Tax=Letharia columbiana TaxID=112416 RepID=A0A8H6G448_9LECA|nr:uncharacterized protein HO173_001870 [Letharia columbiana]KAF6240259.1 hypothetical protein HO173_001870 [Letharia columbiana]